MATYYFTSLFKKADVRITTPYSTTHKALDLSRGVVKQPIYSPNKLGSGTVTKIATSYTRLGVVYKNTLIVGIKYDNGMYIEMYHGEVGDKVVNLGDRITVGKQIYKTGNTGYSFGDHLHIALKNSSGVYINPFEWVINDNVPVPAFKVGAKVIYTGIQNIRKGAGDKFGISRATVVGEIATIKDGPRTSQNKQFNLGENDSYTWWDMTFSNGTGWVADVNKFKIYVAPVEPPVVTPPVEPPVVTPPVEPQPPVVPPEETECEKQVKALEEQLRVKAEALAKVEGGKKEALKEVTRLNGLLEENTEELETILKSLDNMTGEKTKYQKLYMETIKELNELKNQKNWLEEMIGKIRDIIKENKDKLIKLIKGE